MAGRKVLRGALHEDTYQSDVPYVCIGQTATATVTHDARLLTPQSRRWHTPSADNDAVDDRISRMIIYAERKM